jgi:hypothetical protein
MRLTVIKYNVSFLEICFLASFKDMCANKVDGTEVDVCVYKLYIRYSTFYAHILVYKRTDFSFP